MSKKFIYEQTITDKIKSLQNFNSGLLLRTNQIFHWDNSPVDQSRLEYTIQNFGKTYIIKNENNYFCLQGNLTGKQNTYGEWSHIEINNPYNNKINGKYKIFDIDTIKDDSINYAVEIKNNYLSIPVTELTSHYAVLCVECEITLRTFIINCRNLFTLVSGDNKSKRNCEIFLEKLENGDLTILSDNAFLESVKVLPTSIHGDMLYKLVETLQYLKASALHDVGINANFDLKKSITTRAENDLNMDYLIPLVDNMHRQRILSCELLNKCFGLNVSCNLHSTWLAEKIKSENVIHDSSEIDIVDSDQNEKNVNDHIIESAKDDI